MKKILSLALALMMLLSLAACGGKDGGKTDPTLGKYVGQEYTAGDDEWIPMDAAYGSGENYIELKSGGKAVFCIDGDADEVKWSLDKDGVFKLTDSDMECVGTLKDGLITIDFWGFGLTMTFQKEGGSEVVKTGDKLLDWWNGDWYGWWKMTGCSGYYEDMEGGWWDICGNIDIGADKTGVVRLWDED